MFLWFAFKCVLFVALGFAIFFFTNCLPKDEDTGDDDVKL